MGFLVDLLADVFGGGLGPSTSRGLMVLGLTVGIGLCAANGWLLMTAADPLREPEWAFGMIVGGMIIPPAMMLLSTVTIRREPEERALAVTTLAANAAALAVAFAVVL